MTIGKRSKGYERAVEIFQELDKLYQEMANAIPWADSDRLVVEVTMLKDLEVIRKVIKTYNWEES